MKTLKLTLFIFSALAWGTVWAAPGLINYQGRLTDSGGSPITGATNVTFTFWDAATGGTQLGGGFSDMDTVTPDANGIYSTDVGDDPGDLIPASVFAGDSVWLNVNVGGEDLVPRLRIESAGFAVNSGELEGHGASDFLNMSSDAYVVVKTTSDPVQNGANLLAAYAAAKALTPNGAALSATNRAAVLVPPGNYDLGTGELTLDTEFVDLIGLSSKREDQFIFGQTNGTDTGVLRQTANDVGIENLVVKSKDQSGSVSANSSDPAAYFPDSYTTQTVIRNCEFQGDGAYHSWSMRFGITYSGTYEECTGGDFAFGGGSGGSASGTFTNCAGGGSAFGGGSASGTASGTFTNCNGGSDAFGGLGTASGTFINCTASTNAFGGNGGTASGTFTNCTAGNYAFGGGGSGTASGTFTHCIGADYAFGFNGTASGTFTDCSGGYYSFGGLGSADGGKFYDCVGGINAFTESYTTTPPVQFFCVQNGAQYSGNN